MKCKKCKKSMKVDADRYRYICDCGYEIKWGGKKNDNKRKQNSSTIE